MPESTVEEAAHAHAKALVDGDVGTAFLGMTPDGLAGAMEVGNTTWNIMSYKLGEQRQEGVSHGVYYAPSECHHVMWASVRLI